MYTQKFMNQSLLVEIQKFQENKSRSPEVFEKLQILNFFLSYILRVKKCSLFLLPKIYPEIKLARRVGLRPMAMPLI